MNRRENKRKKIWFYIRRHWRNQDPEHYKYQKMNREVKQKHLGIKGCLNSMLKQFFWRVIFFYYCMLASAYLVVIFWIPHGSMLFLTALGNSELLISSYCRNISFCKWLLHKLCPRDHEDIFFRRWFDRRSSSYKATYLSIPPLISAYISEAEFFRFALLPITYLLSFCLEARIWWSIHIGAWHV